MSGLRSGVISAAKKVGLHVSSMENTIERKRLQVFERSSITIVLDVGANKGGYTHELRDSGYTGRIVSFEPISEVFAALRAQFGADPAWHGENIALGDNDGETEIHISANTVSSSLLSISETTVNALPQTAYQKNETIRVARLDTLRTELLKPSDHVYLKLDVQGFEKQVLLGAEQTLKQVKAIEMELSMRELYSGQSLMPELCVYLYDLGYRLIWFERGFKDPDTGYILQADGIFLRES